MCLLQPPILALIQDACEQQMSEELALIKLHQETQSSASSFISTIQINWWTCSWMQSFLSDVLQQEESVDSPIYIFWWSD